ncbi:hypothetical protein JTB14_014134 [Gonioctena quinquepunctata]|nr:hypothetical protein JTB14_014134 [Gonioctena quinquepunctata]
MNVCKFCKESKTNMKRHLMSKHQDENEVKEYSLLSDENPLKKMKLAQIRRDGNFQSFQELGRVIPARLPPQSVPSKTDYVACPTCFVILKKQSLHRHVTKSCKGMSTSSSKECIKLKDYVGKSNAEDLTQLLNTALPAHVNKTATESLLKQERSKQIKLPSTEDIRLLNNYLLKQCGIHFDKLSKKFDKQSWIELSGAVLLGLLIFNRKRPGELER